MKKGRKRSLIPYLESVNAEPIQNIISSLHNIRLKQKQFKIVEPLQNQKKGGLGKINLIELNLDGDTSQDIFIVMTHTQNKVFHYM